MTILPNLPYPEWEEMCTSLTKTEVRHEKLKNTRWQWDYFWIIEYKKKGIKKMARKSHMDYGCGIFRPTVIPPWEKEGVA